MQRTENDAPDQSARGRAGWISFWNANTTIYVNDRHKRVHYRVVAQDFARLLPERGVRVLDFGCGEALSADLVAERCSKLVLSDAADTVRAGLERRFAGNPLIIVASPEAVAAMPDGSFDVIFANSVLQYFAQPQLAPQMAEWHRLLAPGGKLILGDLIPHDAGMVSDVTALLGFAFANGFGVAACIGLVKTFFSDYRKKRALLGLLRFSEQEALDLASSTGFKAQRLAKNIGHNPTRMTFVVTRA
ncbi:MAG: class I SAM-dependent methyltransferase [Hyphomicrobiaceae bacterium]